MQKQNPSTEKSPGKEMLCTCGKIGFVIVENNPLNPTPCRKHYCELRGLRYEPDINEQRAKIDNDDQ